MSFIHGIELCRRFHAEVVEPLLTDSFPSLMYSAALLGPGSEVLGYDTEMSTDHDWGPRVYLFLNEEDIGYSEQIEASLRERAPAQFYGIPVDVKMSVISTIPMFIESCLGLHIHEPMEAEDWLTFPSQSLLEITRGAVFRDDTGQLTALRKQFNYYPHSIWLYLMASNWQRISQEEHLMLRSGYAGDELGSAVIASRIVRDIMNNCFLLERQYAPYPKWFGTAFNRLECSDQLMPCLWTAQTAGTWRERENALNSAYTHLSSMHNRLGITEMIPDNVSTFYDRPFKVMHGEGIAKVILKHISDNNIRQLAEKRLIGNIDQITDNTDFRKLSHLAGAEGKYAKDALKRLFKPFNRA
ncbi:DUF4037 domain-containing protein [Paenibacillus dokdonensis]|uniref:DUF4037 domain-containing protein n=1 Tax=Paenibacillus dokdonensis TaxID=2567944 RepID=UPI0010A79DE4|nr:DUF4037 domain-containing protein [Paenibacillus dokdonensis]